MEIFDFHIILSSHLAMHKRLLPFGFFFFGFSLAVRSHRKHAKSSSSSYRLMHEALAVGLNFMNTTVFICSFVCSCVLCVYFKSPKLHLETLNVSLTNSEKFDIHQEAQIQI